LAGVDNSTFGGTKKILPEVVKVLLMEAYKKTTEKKQREIQEVDELLKKAIDLTYKINEEYARNCRIHIDEFQVKVNSVLAVIFRVLQLAGQKLGTDVIMVAMDKAIDRWINLDKFLQISEELKP